MRGTSRGDRVLVTGCDLSETRDGGYAELARVPGDAVVPIPTGLDERSAMAIGTAGFTAALAIHRMEETGRRPRSGRSSSRVRPAASAASPSTCSSARGYQVDCADRQGAGGNYLRRSALRRCCCATLDYGSRPLERAQFGGAIDNVGAETLAWLTRTVSYGGNIASVGLAGGPRLETTVMPFILRAVNLLGIKASRPRAPCVSKSGIASPRTSRPVICRKSSRARWISTRWRARFRRISTARSPGARSSASAEALQAYRRVGYCRRGAGLSG